MSVHPTAIVDAGARLADGVTVGPYSVIGADVEIGEGTWIGPHVVINGPTRIGCENKIFQFASIGEAPQDLKYFGESTRLEIGDRNVFRESTTINRGTVSGGGVTKIGNDNLLMAYVHVAHDCDIADHVIFSNNTSLAGHVTVQDHVILSGFTLVHQFCTIGEHAFVGMGSAVSKDVPPFILVNGNPGKPHGLNSVGLKRRGYSDEQLLSLRRAYKTLYRMGLTMDDAKKKLRDMASTDNNISKFVEFVDAAQRGVIR